jgi:hypothetical protein
MLSFVGVIDYVKEDSMKTRRALGFLTACLLLLQAGVADAASPKPLERFTCFAVNMTGMGKGGAAGMVQIAINRWSTEAERDALRGTLVTKGPDALLSALQKTKPPVGYMRLPNTRGWDLYFARDIRKPDGSRQIILASDRYITFGEAASSSRSMQYQFTVIDIRFDAEGKGTGELAGAAKVSLNKETNLIEIENYSARPVDLINVKVDKP